jgi:hypothetical protein
MLWSSCSAVRRRCGAGRAVIRLKFYLCETSKAWHQRVMSAGPVARPKHCGDPSILVDAVSASYRYWWLCILVTLCKLCRPWSSLAELTVIFTQLSTKFPGCDAIFGSEKHERIQTDLQNYLVVSNTYEPCLRSDQPVIPFCCSTLLPAFTVPSYKHLKIKQDHDAVVIS